MIATFKSGFEEEAIRIIFLYINFNFVIIKKIFESITYIINKIHRVINFGDDIIDIGMDVRIKEINFDVNKVIIFKIFDIKYFG